jgi:acyl-homoserine-lactone acylase
MKVAARSIVLRTCNALLAVSLGCGDGEGAGGGESREEGALEPSVSRPEILWDEWGVPHIFSPDNRGMFYAFGWAQAQNHRDLLLRSHAEARGEAASLGGEAYLEGDLLVHRLGIPDEAAAEYAGMSPEWQGYFDAFARGVNDFVAGEPDAVASEWRAVLPLDGEDVAALGMYSLRYRFVAGDGIRLAQQEPAVTPSMGSNAWGIGPSRSASGNTLLLMNPHQPWQGAGMLTEAHLVGPDYDFYGATTVGSPLLTFGFNDQIGWTHTVNTHDGWDVYRLTLTPDGGGYLFDGEERTFDVRQGAVLVKQADGSSRSVPWQAQRSIHGPVLSRDDAAGTALALRVIEVDDGRASAQWWEMGHARSLEQFEAALADVRIPVFTIQYADRAGNILQVFNERVPVRKAGDWAFWNNTTLLDASAPAIIPGDSSEYLWSEYHSYAELPRVENPASGYLQNTNEPPWTMTLPPPLDPAAYPAYMLPPPFVLPRTSSSLRLLEADEAISYDELVRYKFDTRVALADYVLDDLISAGESSESALVQQAIALLSAWDRHADASSVGAVLFASWAAAYVNASVVAVPFSLAEPLATPRGLNDPEGALAALEQVAAELEQFRPLLGVGMDMPYGNAFRMRLGAYDLPASGADNFLGTFSTLTFERDPDLLYRAVSGDSFIALVEFSDPQRAQVLLTHGNASQPGSPHLGDQLELFSRRELRDVTRLRGVLEASAVDRVVLQP